MNLLSSGLGSTIEVVWWLAFMCALGLSLGSFLNVIIYRLPRNLSLGNPKWSFCPGCHTRIHWYDNLPVLGFLRLGGRCRGCKTSISLRYPVGEMTAALVVLLIFDAFLIAHTHVGLVVDYPGITWQLSEDWPILLAHIILFMALLAMSAIDLEHYWVDIRFTTMATVAGFILHALWTPERSSHWPRPSTGLSAGSLVAVVVFVLTLLALRMFMRPPPEENIQDESIDTPENPAPNDDAVNDSEAGIEGATAASEPSETRRLVAVLGAIAAASSLLILATGALMEGASLGTALSHTARWVPGLVFLFLLIQFGAAEQRESDDEIIDVIESEKSTARRTVLLELLIILPTIGLGGVTWYYGASCSNTSAMFAEILQWSPTTDWTPLRGLGTAASGFLLGGAIGWAVRILATLIMGREAFGSGDIHMMAAAGCVCGWPTVLAGFVLCSVLAVAGWVMMLPIKRTRAIPLGPWLSISFLIVVLYYDQIMESKLIRNVAYLFDFMPVIFENITGSG